MKGGFSINTYYTTKRFFLLVGIIAICLQCSCAGAITLSPYDNDTPQKLMDPGSTTTIPDRPYGFFVPMNGSDTPDSGFHYSGKNVDYFFMPDEILMTVPDVPAPDSTTNLPVRFRFEGQNPDSKLMGKNLLNGTAQFFIGNDPSQWKMAVPLYGEVMYQDIYSGIDLHYREERGHLKSTFIVAPGADPSSVHYIIEGGKSVQIDQQGALVISSAGGRQITEEPPTAYQEIGGGVKSIPVSYYLIDEAQVGYVLGWYDPAYPLVIDPEVITSGYLGGNVEDTAYGIALDPRGTIYIIGTTYSGDFPVTRTAFNTTWGGFTDIFVTAYTKAGTEVLYSTYLGGAGNDNGRAIAVNPEGIVYITGSTECPDFPVKNAFQTTMAGAYDAFITALSQDGSALEFSSYLGGSDMDDARDIALSGQNNTIYLTGITRSNDFPVKNAVQKKSGGELDAFITVMDGNGTSIISSTYLGGSKDDYGRGIAVDTNGSIYVTGYTYSSKTSDFPVKNPFMGPHTVTYDAFVSRYTPGASDLVYSTYLGGTWGDRASAIAVDPNGTAYVIGYTYSDDYPTTPGAFQRAFGGGVYADVFITGIAPDGQSLASSTYLGGSRDDFGNSITLTPYGHVYGTGGTTSSDFPLREPWKDSLSGPMDAFVAGLDASLSNPEISSYFGGNGSDFGNAIESDAHGVLFVAGSSNSDQLPAIRASQAYNGGDFDAFLVAIAPSRTANITSEHTPPREMPFLSLEFVVAALWGGFIITCVMKKKSKR